VVHELSGTAAERLADVRAWWRLARPPKALGTRLEAGYILALATGTIGLLLYGTASSALADGITPHRVPVWGPPLLLLAVALIARWGSWQGPAVFARADIGFMLGAPLPRAGLTAPRLRWSLVRGAVAAVVAGAVVLVGLGGRGRSVAVDSAAGLLVGLALCGALAVALAWGVQCSARASGLLGRLVPVAALVSVGMVLLSNSGSLGRELALWSGPWGWATQPVGGVPAARWGAALVLLAVTSVAACWIALRNAAACSTERHAVRAEAREGAVASLSALDVRTAQLALRRVDDRRHRRPWRSRIPAPSHPALAVPWRDATATLRAPGRLAEAALLVAAGMVLALTNATHFLDAALAGLLVYLAVTRLLEPLRIEVDAPGAARNLLVRRFGSVLLSHVAVPLTIVAVAAGLTIVPCALTHVIVAQPGKLALLALVTLPTAALCAALSARRGGRMPLSVLFFASGPDPSGGGLVIVGWLVMWPAIAAAVCGLATHLATIPRDLSSALILALVAPVVLGTMLVQSRA
jgi:hypothetical protein